YVHDSGRRNPHLSGRRAGFRSRGARTTDLSEVRHGSEWKNHQAPGAQMTRWIMCAAALLVACGGAKPKADSALTAAPDTVKPAVVSAPDTVKQAAPATTPTSATKT